MGSSDQRTSVASKTVVNLLRAYKLKTKFRVYEAYDEPYAPGCCYVPVRFEDTGLNVVFYVDAAKVTYIHDRHERTRIRVDKWLLVDMLSESKRGDDIHTTI